MLMQIQPGLVLGDSVTNASLSGAFDSLLKIIFVLIFGIYVAFAFIAVRQISSMRKTLVTSFSPVIAIAGFAHFALAVIIFFFSLFI